MSIIVDKNTRVMIQGITGQIGLQYANRMSQGYTNLVAGVTPGKGGQEVCGVPVYNTVREAVLNQRPTLSMIVVPPKQVLGAVFETIEQGVKIIEVYTDEVPLHDISKMISYAKKEGVTLIGPGAAGVVTPEQCNISEISEKLLAPGNIGVLTKSGSLCGEVLRFMGKENIGQSTVCAVGGGFITGLRLKDVMEMFIKDELTSHIVMLGEVGGADEIEAAEVIAKAEKPVLAYVAGHYAPPGVRMGHAGAILGEVQDSADHKTKVLREAGALVADCINDLFDLMCETKIN